MTPRKFPLKSNYERTFSAKSDQLITDKKIKRLKTKNLALFGQFFYCSITELLSYYNIGLSLQT